MHEKERREGEEPDGTTQVPSLATVLPGDVVVQFVAYRWSALDQQQRGGRGGARVCVQEWGFLKEKAPGLWGVGEGLLSCSLGWVPQGPRM